MNYTEITELALSYSDRESDAEIPSKIDGFLRITEARMNRALKVGDMSARSTIDLSTLLATQEYFALPSDFGGLRDIEYKIGTKRYTMNYLNPEQMNGIVSQNEQSSNQYYYTLVGGELQIWPQRSEGTLEIVYFKRVPVLDDALITTNWMSDLNPDCYIFGILVEINAFAKDKEATALWDARFTEALEEIDYEDTKRRWSGSPMTVKLG